MKAGRVFLYVQHLLGIGHLRRTAILANALARRGSQVTLASGGFPAGKLKLDRVEFVQLPPAGASDATFKSLVDAQGNPVDDRWKAARRDFLATEFLRAGPDLLVVELFPFGRRQLRFELVPLLDLAVQAARRPLIVSSVRDILGSGQKDPSRQDEMLRMFDQYFDRVLVHGDPALIPFSRTFRHADAIAGRLHYTGYIVDEAESTPASPSRNADEEEEVLVSAGGGAVGMKLLETAIRARTHSALGRRTWRVLGGVNSAASELGRLAKIAADTAGGAVEVERSRPDFPALLRNCAVSVNQGGYNTVLEVIQARARSVVVPFAGEGETEQSIRAHAFAQAGLLDCIDEEALNPISLAAAIDHAATRPRPLPTAVNMGGAGRSAELLGAWMAERAC